MASLVEELVTVLEEEEKIYQTLISYGEKKTDILIRADVPELEKLTCLEQLATLRRTREDKGGMSIL